MTAEPPEQPKSQSTDPDSAELLRSLRRKEGIWVDWGRACQTLQKSGLSPQQIFEETGFEPMQQNQIIVASQVYASMVSSGVSDAVRSHFEQRGSDTLYEFRILAQNERAAAAKLALEKGFDSEAAREVAKAIREYSHRVSSPQGFAAFADCPGDAVAYHYWKLARQQGDLQARSRLIALGFKFVDSVSGRQQLEGLLSDFTVMRSRPAPRLPIYRMDSDEELPRILPVVGRMPLTVDDLKAVPLVEDDGPFRMVKFSATGAWVPVPGWQVVLVADDPVVLMMTNDQFPNPLPGRAEEVLVVVDRSQRQWNPDSYFIAGPDGQLQMQWFEEEPAIALLGRVILVLRPKKVLDEDYSKDLWQIEE